MSNLKPMTKTSLNTSSYRKQNGNNKISIVAIKEEICNFFGRLQEVFVNLFRVLDARLRENS